MSETITLYLIRHGLAGEFGTYANDDERPLTEEGHRKTGQVARRLADLKIQFDIVLTSPLVRARQTADILIETGLGPILEEVSYLRPGGSINEWLTWLKTWKVREDASLALVGHQPALGDWASTLIWGEAKGIIELKKAGVVGLSLPGKGSPIGRSTLFWLTPPRLLLGT
jgi:phosphohistidine phosphatase